MNLRIKRALFGGTLVTALSVLAAAAFGAGSASAASLHTLRIAYDPNPANLTIPVAEQQGFFKKNGINAKLTSTQSSVTLISSLGKNFDLTSGDPLSVLEAASNGLKPMLVSSMDIESAKLPDTYLLADKTITSLKQLKGKKIGVVALTGNIYEGTVEALAKVGVKKSEVQFLAVPFADMASDLQSGTIDAAATIVPFQKQILGEGYTNLGDPVLAALNNQTTVDLGWVANGPWADAHKSLIDAFVRSQKEALAWIKSHVAAARELLVKDFQLPAVAADNTPVYQYFSFGIKAAYLTQWIAPMKTLGILPKSFSTNVSKLVF